MKRPEHTHLSDRLPSKDQRRKAREALRRGQEPEPEYRTGRFWND